MIVFYIRLALGLSVVVVAAWLFWPVGGTAFEWRPVAMAMIDAGNCESADRFLSSIRMSEPNTVDPIIEGRAYQTACVSTDLPGSIDRALAEVDRLQDRVLETTLSIDAAEFWANGRRIRQRERLGFFGAREFVIQFRCLAPLTTSRRVGYMRARRWATATEFDVGRPTGAIRRAQWCANLMASQIEVFESRPVSATLSDLSSMYRTQLAYLAEVYQMDIE